MKIKSYIDLSKQHISIITRESEREISFPTFGGSRLIHELKKEMEQEGHKISIISLHNLDSLSSKILKINKEKRRKIKKILPKNEKIKWLISLVMALLGEIISRVDSKFLKQLEDEIKQTKCSAIIYNGTIGGLTIYKIAKKLNLFFILCEHNIDFYFFADKLGIFFTPLIFLFKAIEINLCKRSDLIICFNENDRRKLINIVGCDPNRVIIWKFEIKPKKYNKEKAINEIPSDIKTIIKNKPVVTFLGANYTPNILAVNYILKIAKEIQDVIFLIVGSVGEKFNRRKDIPKNVIFTGFVKNIKLYLAVSDIFLNLKMTSDTGIEAKMFDYLEFDKPIISTRIGAAGFEHCKNVIVADSLDEIKEKILELTKVRK